MADSTERTNFIRRYLLGQLPQPERSAFEEQYSADENAFEELTEVENDLIDDYVRGALSGEDRAQFLNYFLITPNRHKRVAFARSLFEYAAEDIRADRAAKSASPDSKPYPAVFSQPSLLRRAASLAVLLALAAVIWLIVLNNRLRGELHDASAQQRELQQQQQELRQQIAQLSAQLEASADAFPAPGQTAVTVTLSPQLERGPASGNMVPLPQGASEATLVLLRKPEGYLTYSALLQTVEGHEIWNGRNLPARTVNHTTVITIKLTASMLRPGDYILKLTGATPAGQVEQLDPYSFRVLKR